jgi:hypothetical protein
MASRLPTRRHSALSAVQGTSPTQFKRHVYLKFVQKLRNFDKQDIQSFKRMKLYSLRKDTRSAPGLVSDSHSSEANEATSVTSASSLPSARRPAWGQSLRRNEPSTSSTSATSFEPSDESMPTFNYWPSSWTTARFTTPLMSRERHRDSESASASMQLIVPDLMGV